MCASSTPPSCTKLKGLLYKSVQKNHADALLLSGGLDSSILACLAKPKVSFTISLGDNAPDLEYANAVAAKYSREHIVVKLTNEKLLEIIEELIKIMKTFSPLEIRNSSVALAGIKAAANKGCEYIMTGDGGDELFAGYNYLSRYYHDIKMLDKEIRKLWDTMHFSSLYLGEIAGIDVKTPFLEEDFVKYAKSIQIVDKIGNHHGSTWGKFILRKCYESDLGEEIVWRRKLAQEEGAGTTNIRTFISEKLDDDSFILEQKMRYLNQQNSEIRNIFTIIYCTESILLLLKKRVVIITFAAQNAKGVLQPPVNIAVFVVHFQSSQKDRYHDNGCYLTG